MEWLDFEHIKEIFLPADPQYLKMTDLHYRAFFFSLYNQKSFSFQVMILSSLISHHFLTITQKFALEPRVTQQTGDDWRRHHCDSLSPEITSRLFQPELQQNALAADSDRCSMASFPRQARCLPCAIKNDSYTAQCQNQKNRSTLAVNSKSALLWILHVNNLV